MAVKVSITGTLSQPRKSIIQLIESKTNAEFSPHVTYDTNYLVAARFDTNKAKRAAQIGVSVISEPEMLEYIQQGSFPENHKPVGPIRVGHNNFPEIQWSEFFDPERLVLLEYEDAAGSRTQRFVVLSCKGAAGEHHYWGGYDREHFKTFRDDRIIGMEDIRQ